MTKFLYCTMLIIVLLLASIATKPTDQDCINKVVANKTGTNLLSLFAPRAGSVLYKIEDDVFYKNVIDRTTGRVVAIGIFGTVKIYNQ